MELRDLRAFATVVELGGVSRASEHLHVVQSAVSQAVRRLEKELRVTLLIRRPGSGGVRPTDAGLALARHAEVIMNAVSRARVEMAEYAGGLRGTVKVGILPTATPLVLAPLIRAARRGNPGLQVHAVEAPGPELMEHLRLGRIELAIVFMPMAVEGMVAYPLYEMELVVIAAGDRALPSTVNVRDLAMETWVTFPPQHPGRDWLDNSFWRLGLRPRVGVQVETFTQLKASVEAGAGLAMVPMEATTADVQAGLLRMTRLQHPPRCELAYLGDLSRPSPAVRAIKSLLDEMGHAGRARQGT